MSKLRGYYKSSSAYIHGNFKASEESLGIMPNIEKILLVGPSNYGLSIPMQNIAISLVIISITFLSTYSTIDTIVSCLIMRSFMEKILIEADKIQAKIENLEMKLRGEHSNILLTGFKGKTNSSSTLLYNIHLGKSIDRLELTNSFSTSQKELIRTLKNNYKYVIAFGQKPNSNRVNIEISANKNKIELNTKFPYEKLKEFLDKENILNDISMDAGAYLCNNAYFEGLNYIKNNKMYHLGEQYLPKNIANKVEHNPYYYQNRYMEFIHNKKKKQKYKVYKYKGKFNDISKMSGIDVLFLLLFHLLGLLPKRENYQPLSPEMRQEIRKMGCYSNEIRLIVTAKLKTTEDVKNYISQTEKDIKDVTNLRQKYRNKLRNCKDDNLIEEYKEKRNECTTVLNKYRKNLKIANYILEDTPKVKEVIKIEMQMKNGQEDITKTKKNDRNVR